MCVVKDWPVHLRPIRTNETGKRLDIIVHYPLWLKISLHINLSWRDFHSCIILKKKVKCYICCFWCLNFLKLAWIDFCDSPAFTQSKLLLCCSLEVTFQICISRNIHVHIMLTVHMLFTSAMLLYCFIVLFSVVLCSLIFTYTCEFLPYIGSVRKHNSQIYKTCLFQVKRNKRNIANGVLFSSPFSMRETSQRSRGIQKRN